MARLNKTIFSFVIPAANQIELNVMYPTPGSLPELVKIDNAALTAVLTAGEKTALINLLTKVANKLDNDMKAILDARRAAMNTDP